eukprot:TRINITY_DN67493_c0_g1_i2.p1 TRINITY_DN67493_c0_g1~~TRINITY_DN67493_c0_g1_i2.p1  ORF type:complete len:620 (-),score=122.25 TRINITY_DN67493_c0_g1_i2:124-1779(-)
MDAFRDGTPLGLLRLSPRKLCGSTSSPPRPSSATAVKSAAPSTETIPSRPSTAPHQQTPPHEERRDEPSSSAEKEEEEEEAQQQQQQHSVGFSFGEKEDKDDNGAMGGGGFSFGGGFAFGDDAQQDDNDDDFVPPPPKPAAGGRTRRKTVSSEAYNEEEALNFTITPIPKSSTDTAALTNVLRGLVMFSQLDDREIRHAVDALFKCDFLAGDILFEQDGMPGEGIDKGYFYIVMQGEAEVLVDGNQSGIVSCGDFCGENELLVLQPRQATVKVTSPTMTAWAMERSTYRHMMTGTFSKKRKLYCGFLGKVGFLQGVSEADLCQIADCLQAAQYNEGDYLIRYGQEGEWMFIIEEGMVEVLGRDETDDTRVVEVCTFTTGEPIGELEFIFDHATVADVRAKTPVRAVKLHKPHFEMCMGDMKDVLAQNASVNEKYKYYQQKKGLAGAQQQSTTKLASDAMSIASDWDTIVQGLQNIFGTKAQRASIVVTPTEINCHVQHLDSKLKLCSTGQFAVQQDNHTIQGVAHSVIVEQGNAVSLVGTNMRYTFNTLLG